jgi:hypothetical protein
MEIKRNSTNFLSGIDIKLLVDEKSQFIEESICQICLNLSINPKHCKSCGKIFCGYCIDNWMKKSQSCPNCRENTFEAPPRILMNFLGKIRLKCHYPECNKLIFYNDFLDHVNNCDFGSFLCGTDGCHFSGTKGEIISHQSVCMYATQDCPYCNLKLVRKLLENHFNICEGKGKVRNIF